ncbi:MAG: VWA domain-containing protein, partial [Beijerinckiaceae bacterium]
MAKVPENIRGKAPAPASSGGVEAFLDAVANAPVPHSGGRGRLVFALDATMSRQPTWVFAQGVQARMFETAYA